MYHPTRGGVRGGRDQFKWDDVKVDKHRENYIGHSVKAPVGRWQKGKDLQWYTKDKSALKADMDAAKEEIKRIKEEEEQAMREALGLAPKRSSRPQGNRLDKHEFQELVKRGSTAEDLGAGHAEATHVQELLRVVWKILRVLFQPPKQKYCRKGWTQLCRSQWQRRKNANLLMMKVVGRKGSVKRGGTRNAMRGDTRSVISDIHATLMIEGNIKVKESVGMILTEMTVVCLCV
ncbi:hypothetical protein ACHQM5_013826 [Ranunculus cassubicifolius]